MYLLFQLGVESHYNFGKYFIKVKDAVLVYEPEVNKILYDEVLPICNYRRLGIL